jgi:hypothetical protein
MLTENGTTPAGTPGPSTTPAPAATPPATAAPATAAPAPSPAPGTPPAPAPGGFLTQDQVNQLLQKQRTELQADFKTQLEQATSGFKGQVLEALQAQQGQQGQQGRPGTRPAPAPAPAAAPAPGQSATDPAFLALQTELNQLRERQQQTDALLAQEQERSRAAAEQAEAGRKQQAVYAAFTAPDVRLAAEQASLATEHLMLKGMVQKGQDGQFYYVEGQTSLPLAQGVKHWLASPAGLALRPAVSPGSGGPGNPLFNAGQAPANVNWLDGPPSPAKFSEAMQRDAARRGGRASA